MRDRAPLHLIERQAHRHTSIVKSAGGGKNVPYSGDGAIGIAILDQQARLFGWAGLRMIAFAPTAASARGRVAPATCAAWPRRLRVFGRVAFSSDVYAPTELFERQIRTVCPQQSVVVEVVAHAARSARSRATSTA